MGPELELDDELDSQFDDRFDNPTEWEMSDMPDSVDVFDIEYDR